MIKLIISRLVKRMEPTKGKPMDPMDVEKMDDSHICAECESLVVEVEFKSGEKEDLGCKCEIGGEG